MAIHAAPAVRSVLALVSSAKAAGGRAPETRASYFACVSLVSSVVSMRCVALIRNPRRALAELMR